MVREKRQRSVICGLTLIEVLIALSIVSIAITAIIKATSQNIRSNAYLENKMVANWVAQSVMNQISLGLLNVADDDEIEKETELLGKRWHYKAKQQATANADINKVIVNVYSNKTEDSPLITIESFLYHEPQSNE